MTGWGLCGLRGRITLLRTAFRPRKWIIEELGGEILQLASKYWNGSRSVDDRERRVVGNLCGDVISGSTHPAKARPRTGRRNAVLLPISVQIGAFMRIA